MTEPINNQAGETPAPQVVETPTPAVEQTAAPVAPAISASGILDDLEKTLEETKEPEEEVQELPPAPSVRNDFPMNTVIELDPLKEGSNKNRPEVLVVPSAPLEETVKRLASIRSEEVSGSEKAANWAAVTQEGIPRASFDGQVDRILARTGAKWTQRLAINGAFVGHSASRAEVEQGAVLSGMHAVSAAMRHVGIGGNFTTPLYHSGFHLTLKPPMEDTLIELNRQMNNIKTEVGRNTYGLMLDSYSGLLNELFLRFALAEMQRNSVKDVDDLLKIISVHDINVVLWAFVCTIYPNGFNHKAPCIADPSKCHHVVEDLINVRRLFFANQNAFSEEQLVHMTSSHSASMTIESVMKYREKMRESEARVIEVGDEGAEIRFHMRVPSAFEYFDSTNRWIQGITVKVIQALGADSSFNDRNKLISEHAASTKMRKFAHWIEKIDIGGAFVEDRESIEQTLDSLSSSIEIRDSFEKKVTEYVESTCHAVIGVPDFECPSCKKMQITPDNTHPLHRSIVGIDVLMTFFTVLVQRVQSVRE